MTRRAASIISLPWPPSANVYYRFPRTGAFAGRALISREGRAYREVVAAMMHRENYAMHTERLRVVIEARPPDRRRRDLDNILKASLDALVFAGVLYDDSLIDDLRVHRGPVLKPGELLVKLEPLE